MNDEDYNFSVEKINWSKVAKTMRGSIKKGIFYLGLKVSYKVTERLTRITNFKNDSILKNKLGRFFNLFILDAKIRYCDDILDEVLAKQKPLPYKRMNGVINDFKLDMGENFGRVPELFRKELDLLQNSKGYSKKLIMEKIKEIIEIRPCDYFLLIENLIEKFGTNLSKESYENSFKFYKEFQRLRDLLDDMMCIEEDVLKKDYNHVVMGKKKGISYKFFDSIIREKFRLLKYYSGKIKKHPQKKLFKKTIIFWETEYNELFKPLLLGYYRDVNEFNKLYFMIKQL